MVKNKADLDEEIEFVKLPENSASTHSEKKKKNVSVLPKGVGNTQPSFCCSTSVTTIVSQPAEKQGNSFLRTPRNLKLEKCSSVPNKNKYSNSAQKLQ